MVGLSYWKTNGFPIERIKQMPKKCCDVVYWNHNEGWDVYKKDDCQFVNNHWIPNWFDCFIVEDAPTKKDAIKSINELHILGVCLV
jgi:hypothetical protein